MVQLAWTNEVLRTITTLHVGALQWPLQTQSHIFLTGSLFSNLFVGQIGIRFAARNPRFREGEMYQ